MTNNSIIVKTQTDEELELGFPTLPGYSEEEELHLELDVLGRHLHLQRLYRPMSGGSDVFISRAIPVSCESSTESIFIVAPSHEDSRVLLECIGLFSSTSRMAVSLITPGMAAIRVNGTDYTFTASTNKDDMIPASWCYDVATDVCGLSVLADSDNGPDNLGYAIQCGDGVDVLLRGRCSETIVNIYNNLTGPQKRMLARREKQKKQGAAVVDPVPAAPSEPVTAFLHEAGKAQSKNHTEDTPTMPPATVNSDAAASPNPVAASHDTASSPNTSDEKKTRRRRTKEEIHAERLRDAKELLENEGYDVSAMTKVEGEDTPKTPSELLEGLLGDLDDLKGSVLQALEAVHAEPPAPTLDLDESARQQLLALIG